ncbi:glycerol-3-phosphate 1-O-acyltransferase PlsY [Spirochaetota bacterium]
MLELLFIILASYLLGSFPTGVIAGKLTRGIDIRSQGSGNTGATNSFRVLGWKIGFAVAFVDMAKGFIAVALLTRIDIFNGSTFPYATLPYSARFIAATLAAVLGHIKPVFAGFKGGKGFGTAAGAISAAYPLLALPCLVVFGLTLVLSGYVAVCAAITSFALPFLYLLSTQYFNVSWDPAIFIFFFLAFLLTIVMMRKKLRLFMQGKAELFTKVMLFKPKKLD